MSNPTDVRRDDGRPVTFAVILVGAVMSAAMNLYGAWHLFPGLLASVICLGAIAACEGTAILTLRHIVRDFSNNHEFKALFGTVIFAFCIYGCVNAGHRAIDVQMIELRETNAFKSEQAQRHKDRADAHLAAASLAVLEGDRTTESQEEARARLELDKALALGIEVEKSQPLSAAGIWMWIILLELLKTGGRWALATPSRPQWDRKRRHIQWLKDRKTFEEKKAEFKTAA